MIKKVVDIIKQNLCKHEFDEPVLVYESTEYKPGFIQHPVEKDLQIPVMIRRFKSVRTCKHCGKQQTDEGYDTKDMPQKPNTRFRK